MPATFIASETALYIGDNGALRCGQHLGHTARLTGRDLSGAEVLEVTPEVAALDDSGLEFACEICGHRAGAERDKRADFYGDY